MSSPKSESDPRLIVHIVFRFDYGGLENGVTNLINSLSNGPFRHAVIALTEVTDFSRRLHGDVQLFALGKKPGKDLFAYYRLYRLLRKLKPAVVHTRNIGTLDCSFIAFVARVPIRIHGEHGWDVSDPDGENTKFRLLRKVFSRFVQRFVTVSADLRDWLVTVVGIPATKVTHIYNGVDTNRFRPGVAREQSPKDDIVVGSVTRFSAIKDPLNLVEAFVSLRETGEPDSGSTKLVMIGDGELHERATRLLRHADLAAVSWLPGSRDDIPEQLRSMDVFVLGSLREGISNTILEAMASGLPVISTDTGGNPELIDESNGVLVPPGNRDALARAIEVYVRDPGRRVRHGNASRDRAVGRFSISAMVENYANLYASALAAKGF